MKKLILGVITLMVSVGAFSQHNVSASEATADLIKVYDLDSKQAKEMLVIQERKVRNIDEIAGMKTTDIKKYRHKHRAIQQSTDASIRRMLTEAQMKVYEKRRLKWRAERAAKIAKLKESGMSLEEIEDALLEEGF
ncbi:MAG: hypothetical protein ACI8P3_000049 [Saprospiraceae bacterium]|jgi:hypothetical protein